jgi:hypothetical protein
MIAPMDRKKPTCALGFVRFVPKADVIIVMTPVRTSVAAPEAAFYNHEASYLRELELAS